MFQVLIFLECNWVFPKIMVLPNHPMLNKVFQKFSPSILGLESTPIFGLTSILVIRTLPISNTVETTDQLWPKNPPSNPQINMFGRNPGGASQTRQTIPSCTISFWWMDPGKFVDFKHQTLSSSSMIMSHYGDYLGTNKPYIVKHCEGL